MVKFENIEIKYGDFVAIENLNLDIKEGEFFTFLGPSGCGKTTSLRALVGFLSPSKGKVYVGDKDVTNLPVEKRNIGMVFQSYDLFPNKTVLGNITLAPTLVQKRDKGEVEQEAIRLLERVGLADRKDSWPHELSGGQRQRVAICRALILHPEVLLFDEVTAALDPEMVREVLDVMLELADSGQTMLIVTHEMQFARAIADQVILLEDGDIVERSDDAERFFTNPTTERAKQFLHTFEFDRHRKSAEQSERSEQ